ncbi:flagellar basal body rod protein FlgB [Bacillota bacterium Meth-B3]|nr:flagellar basal body rod protein FlgB [Christensenellaceae bacterium]MEA5065582.1 flagellar basal body rod protein FlgB [Eubacteriales bacterium]
MSNFLNPTSMSLLEKKMDVVWMRQQVISDNIANAATPGYKRKTLEFESLLEGSLNGASGNRRAMEEAVNEVQPRVVEHRDTTAREDGNNVDEDFENVEMVRAYTEYSYLMTSLNAQVRRMKYVLTEGRG